MTREQFTKPHLSVDEQIGLLKDRGMHVQDPVLAKKKLEHVNYYRLGFYWYDFESNHDTHQFSDGADFDQVITRYDFDSELRNLILVAVDQIEISFRSQWVHHLSHDYGPHGHLNHTIHDRSWISNLTSLEREINRCKEEFISKLKEKYIEQTPPLWAVCEVMSFGAVSRWYKSLNQTHTKSKIGRVYSLSPRETESWMQHLSSIRYTCAHHERLWNQRFSRVQPTHPARLSDEFVDQHPLYNTIVIILDILGSIDSCVEWKSHVIELTERYPTAFTDQMGFPENWRNLDIWHI